MGSSKSSLLKEEGTDLQTLEAGPDFGGGVTKLGSKTSSLRGSQIHPLETDAEAIDEILGEMTPMSSIQRTVRNLRRQPRLKRSFSGVFSTPDEQVANTDGISLSMAVLLQFLNALGAGIALVGWYPKLCGTMLFPVAIVAVGITAALGEMAIMQTAQEKSASTFTELCDRLPAWIVRIVEWSIVLSYTIAEALYYNFVFDYVNDQYFAPMGDSDWPWGRAVPGTAGEVGLYLCLFIIGFLVTTPTKFGGCIAVAISCANLIATLSALTAGGIKSSIILASRHEDDRTFNTFVPHGFLQVFVLLTASMMSCGNMPQIAMEVKPASRKRAAVVVPWGVAILQGGVFLGLGLLGYSALGNDINGNVFVIYAEQYPDVWVTIIEVGMMTLLMLSMPFCVMPVKSQMLVWLGRWSIVDPSVTMDAAPAVARHVINAAINGVAVALCIMLGRQGMVNLFTVSSGTMSNFVNLLLPGLVLVWVKILPDRRAGNSYMKNACVASWIFIVAGASFVDALFGIADLLK